MLQRFLLSVLGLSLVTALTGCAMCFTPHDDDYNAYGGLVERQDRRRGRVGSILSDPSLQHVEATGMVDEATEEDLYPADLEQPRIEPPRAQPLPPPRPEDETQTEADADAEADAENDDAASEDA